MANSYLIADIALLQWYSGFPETTEDAPSVSSRIDIPHDILTTDIAVNSAGKEHKYET